MSKWKEVRLGDIVKFTTGKLNSNAATEDGKYPFYTCSQTVFRTDTFSFDTECVILGGNNANAIYPIFYKNGKFDAYQRNYIIEPKDSTAISVSFLYYSLFLRLEYMRVASTGVTTKFLTLKILKNMKFLIPDYKDQKRIADILTMYRNLIENNNRRIEILEETAEEIYKEWFVRMRFPGYENSKFIKGIPEGWETVKLEDICKLVRGISYSTKEIEKDEGIPMLTLKSINAYGGYNYGGIRFFDGKIADRHYLKKDDLIMAITDMTQDRRVIGQVCLIPETNYDELVFSADLILLDELKIEKDYMYALLRYGGLSEHIAMFSNGANVLHLNQRTLNKIRITLASESLRRQYESEHKLIQKQIGIFEIQNQNLIKQRDLLLPRLMNGTIEVK